MTIDRPGEILVERDGGLVRITLSRPEQLNALSTSMLSQLAGALEDAARDSDVRVIGLHGAGRAFCAGADLNAECGGPSRAESAQRMSDAATACRALRTAPKPVIAAVNGPAVGLGCALALAADVVVAARSAYFLVPHVALGLMPDGGLTALLPQAIGRIRASRMTMLQERVPADVAERWGLISRCVPDDDLDHDARRTETMLAEGPTRALARTKLALSTPIDDALATEERGQAELFSTGDHARALESMSRRQLAQFKGR